MSWPEPNELTNTHYKTHKHIKRTQGRTTNNANYFLIRAPVELESEPLAPAPPEIAPGEVETPPEVVALPDVVDVTDAGGAKASVSIVELDEVLLPTELSTSLAAPAAPFTSPPTPLAAARA